eukprot:gene7356-2706_t
MSGQAFFTATPSDYHLPAPDDFIEGPDLLQSVLDDFWKEEPEEVEEEQPFVSLN